MASFTSTYSGDLSEFIAGKIWARVKKSIDDKKIDETNADPIVKDAAKKLKNDNDQDGVIVKDKNLRDQVTKIFGLDLDAKIVRTEGKVDKATAHVATIASGVADTQKLIINHNEVLERKFDEILGVLRDQNELKKEEIEAEKVAEEQDDLERTKQSGIGRRFAKMMGYPSSWGTFLSSLLFSRVRRRVVGFLDPLRRRIWKRIPLLSKGKTGKLLRLITGRGAGLGVKTVLESNIKRLLFSKVITSIQRTSFNQALKFATTRGLGKSNKAVAEFLIGEERLGKRIAKQMNLKAWKIANDPKIPLDMVGDLIDDAVETSRFVGSADGKMGKKILEDLIGAPTDALGLNRIGAPLSKSFGKKSGREIIESLPAGSRAAREMAEATAKTGAKATTKATTGKIPIVGLLLSTGFAVERFMKGDITGGILEILSGVASTVPGKGTALSYLIDAAIISSDIEKAVTRDRIRNEVLREIQNAQGYETGGRIGKGSISNLHGLEYKSTSEDRSAVASSFTDMIDGFIGTLGGGLIGWTSGVGMPGVGQRLLKSEGVEGVQFASLPYSTTVGKEPTSLTYSGGNSMFGSLRDSIYNKRISKQEEQEETVIDEDGNEKPKRNILDPRGLWGGGPGKGDLIAQHSSQVPHNHPIVRIDASGEPGVDFTPNGDNNRAVFEGVVTDIGHQYNPNVVGGDGRMGAGYGHYIGITSVDPKNGEKFESLYAHFPEGELDKWKIGDKVNFGDILGRMGTVSDYANPETRRHVGSGTGPHTSLDFFVPGTNKPYSGWRGLVPSIDPSFRRKPIINNEENSTENNTEEIIPPLPPIPDDLSTNITPSVNTKSSDISRDSSLYNDMKTSSGSKLKREIFVITNNVNTGSPTLKGSGGRKKGNSIVQLQLKRLAV